MFRKKKKSNCESIKVISNREKIMRSYKSDCIIMGNDAMKFA